MKATEHVVSDEAKGGGAPARASMTSSERRVLRVWVVDNNAALRVLFAQLLHKQPGIRCTRQFPSAGAVLAALAEERPPDIILLDVNLDGESGLNAIRPIRKAAPSVKVLTLAMFSNSYYEAEAFRAGASGFLLKSYELGEMVMLIRGAYRNSGDPRLFPSLPLLREAETRLSTAKARTGPANKGFNLMDAWRRLCRNARRRQIARAAS